MSILYCPICNKELVHSGTIETLVGYVSPKDHNHDDNCRKRTYYCSENPKHYKVKLSRRNKCPNKDCDWKGKTECFCHEGKKVDEWPDNKMDETIKRILDNL